MWRGPGVPAPPPERIPEGSHGTGMTTDFDTPSLESVLGSASAVSDSRVAGTGPGGALPLTPEMLRHAPSGDVFGLTQDVGMGWSPSALGGRQYTIISTMGGLRGDDGRPVALGYHTGHWEIGLLVRAAAETLRDRGAVPFAAYCSDPCDGRTQGTTGMFDSLPYRNDAAIVMRRLIRSLPTAAGVMGVATCDKGLPATMLALAGMGAPARRRRAGRRHAAGRRRRGRRAGPEPRGPVRARSDQPGLRGGNGLPGVRVVGRRLPVPRHCRDVAGRGRGARPRVAAQRAGPVGRARLAGTGRAIRARAHAPRCAAPAAPGDPHAAGDRARDARPRRVRRVDEPPPAHSRHRGGRRAAGCRPWTTGFV